MANKLIDTEGLQVFKELIEEQIPENLSELTNDSGFITADDIPTKLSEFENDPRFLTDADMSEYADKNYVDQKVSDLVNSAPEALDTLKELADALGNDKDFASTVTTELGNKADDESVLHKARAETIGGIKTVKFGTPFKFDSGVENLVGSYNDLWVEETASSSGVFSIGVPDTLGYPERKNEPRSKIKGPKLVFDFSNRLAFVGRGNGNPTTKFELHTGTTQYGCYNNDDVIHYGNIMEESAVLKGEVINRKPKLTWDGHEIFDTKNYETWVKNASITIQKNGSVLGTFTLNQAADQTLNIEVPTKLSELENDVNLPTTAEIEAMISAAMPIAITNDEIDEICVRA